MEDFSTFFKNSAKERFTPNTKVHHQNAIRSTDRKHQNQVAARYGYKAKKADPFIDQLVKADKIGKWPISSTIVNRIFRTYGITNIPREQNYQKAINKTGITVSYQANINKFFISRRSINNGKGKIS